MASPAHKIAAALLSAALVLGGAVVLLRPLPQAPPPVATGARLDRQTPPAPAAGQAKPAPTPPAPEPAPATTTPTPAPSPDIAAPAPAADIPVALPRPPLDQVPNMLSYELDQEQAIAYLQGLLNDYDWDFPDEAGLRMMLALAYEKAGHLPEAYAQLNLLEERDAGEEFAVELAAMRAQLLKEYDPEQAEQQLLEAMEHGLARGELATDSLFNLLQLQRNELEDPGRAMEVADAYTDVALERVAAAPESQNAFNDLLAIYTMKLSIARTPEERARIQQELEQAVAGTPFINPFGQGPGGFGGQPGFTSDDPFGYSPRFRGTPDFGAAGDPFGGLP